MALFSKENLSKEKFKKFAADARETIKKRWWVMLIELVALAALLLADLLTKEYAVKFLLSKPDGYEYQLIPGVIHLTYSKNTGAGFGMFAGNTTALTVVTFIVLTGVLIYLIFAQKQNEWLRASLLIILGGGIGNLVDRIGLNYVRDFIDYAFLDNFAICNVADAFVCVGAVMLVIVLIVMLVTEGRKNAKKFKEEQAGKAQEQGEDPLDAPINLNPMMQSPNTYTFTAVPDENATDASSDGAENATVTSSDGNEDMQSAADSESDGMTKVADGERDDLESGEHAEDVPSCEHAEDGGQVGHADEAVEEDGGSASEA